MFLSFFRHFPFCLVSGTALSVLLQTLPSLSGFRHFPFCLASGIALSVLLQALPFLSCFRHCPFCLASGIALSVLLQALPFLSCFRHCAFFCPLLSFWLHNQILDENFQEHAAWAETYSNIVKRVSQIIQQILFL